MRSMKARATGVIALAASVCAGAVIAQAAPIPSEVTIEKGGPTQFSGKVSSPKSKCRGNRDVNLFRSTTPGQQGEQVGTTKTDSAGNWTINGNFQSGLYQAETPKKKVGKKKKKKKCARALSVQAQY